MADVQMSVVYYKITIQRVEPSSPEQRKEWRETVGHAYGQPDYYRTQPAEITTDALNFRADENQFRAIRKAALETMK